MPSRLRARIEVASFPCSCSDGRIGVDMEVSRYTGMLISKLKGLGVAEFVVVTASSLFLRSDCYYALVIPKGFFFVFVFLDRSQWRWS